LAHSNYEIFVTLRKSRRTMEKLTQQEEEAMQVAWDIDGGFIKDFLEQLPEPKPPYTTLASTVKNLEKKGFLKSEKLGNTYRYLPLIKAEDYKKRFMKGFVGDYFKNSYKELVAFFAKEKQISAEELKEIIDMIENKKSE
jgi:BlaI family transcriptional regulator, penicillinase repressor